MNSSLKKIELADNDFLLIAGPCSLESESQFSSVAKAVQELGANCIRGGLFKLRSNARSFQGLQEAGIPLVQQMKKNQGLPFCSEIIDASYLPLYEEHVDIIQVGARNMHNTALLKALGKSKRPILLKRGISARLEEWVQAAYYIADAGNENIILCERGIRTFETATRNTLDLSAIVYIKEKTNFPIIVDPSHGTGIRSYVIPMARAAVAAGADGLMIEVHPEPEKALSDGMQSLTIKEFAQLATEIQPLLKLMGKTIPSFGAPSARELEASL